MQPAALTNPVTAQHYVQFQREGYVILPAAIPRLQLEALRAACGDAIAAKDAAMAAKGITVDGITHQGRRYFLPFNYRTHQAARDFLFGPLMGEVVRATLGPQAFLFLDQFVVKGPDQGMRFAWHQDSGYIPFRHTPYLSCWIALDDMSEANGTISVLPFSRFDSRSLMSHRQEAGTNDMIGYDGDDPGELVEVPAGSIVAFSSRTFHRSGANRLPQLRRAYLCQYSVEPLLKPEGGLWIGAEPVLADGRLVGPPAV